ncbi:MAG: molybdenum cofactor biosynthesis protein MoaE [Thermoprotei archaeon]|nr:molybdenum cofactor biosynthesis protein MoaE [Thermoprotei archaeon]
MKVRLYSLLKDSIGSQELLIELPEGSRVSELIKALENYGGFKRALEAIGGSLLILDEDGSRLSEESPLKSSVIHIMPPPAGGSHIEVGILEPGEDFSLEELEARLPKEGTIAVFVGYVKGLNEGEKVLGLQYEHAGELTLKTLRRIAEEEASKWSLKGIAIYHYVGSRKVGEKTLIIAVSGESRKTVFPALEETVERVKREAPIWKVEQREKGKVYILGDKIIKIAT